MLAKWCRYHTSALSTRVCIHAGGGAIDVIDVARSLKKSTLAKPQTRTHYTHTSIHQPIHLYTQCMQTCVHTRHIHTCAHASIHAHMHEHACGFTHTTIKHTSCRERELASPWTHAWADVSRAYCPRQRRQHAMLVFITPFMRLSHRVHNMHMRIRGGNRQTKHMYVLHVHQVGQDLGMLGQHLRAVSNTSCQPSRSIHIVIYMARYLMQRYHPDGALGKQ